MKKIKKVTLGLTMMSLTFGMAMPAGVVGIPYATTSVLAEVSAQGRCGDSAEYAYDDETNTLTVSGTGAIWDDYGFANSLSEVKKIVIEDGITTIGTYSFEKLCNVSEVSIAGSVTTIKEHAFEYIRGEVAIPASVTNVEENAFSGAEKIVIKGDLTGYAVSAFGKGCVNEIILYGGAGDLGKALYCSEVGTVTIAKENSKCKVSNGCLLSEDGKQMYYYLSGRDKLTIPNTVEAISTGAVSGKSFSEVTLGESLKNIDAFAFFGSYIIKLNTNNALNTIGVKAFDETGIKNVSFNGKVNMDMGAFSNRVTIKNTKKFKYSQTSVDTADVGNSKYNIRYAKVAGAKGYEIRVKSGDKTYKYTTKKNYYRGKAPKALTNDYIASKDYYIVADEYLKDVKDAAYVTVRPYKTETKKKKVKKVYGRWSTKIVLSHR